MEHLRRLARSALTPWLNAVMGAAPLVVAIALLGAGASLYYAATQLGFNTDTTDMLSPELPFRRDHSAYRQAFPQYGDTLIVVVEGATPELAQNAVTRLSARLRQQNELFKTVYLPQDNPFFQRHGLLYLSPAELEALADNLARVQPFLAQLIQDPTLIGLFATLEQALEAVQTGEDLDLAPLFEQIGTALQAIAANRFYTLSWQEIMLGEQGGTSPQRRFIVVQPRLNYDALEPAKPAMQTVRQAAAELELNPAHGVRVRLTGWVAIAYEELQSVSRGFGIGALITLGLVSLVLFIALRAWQLILATLATLLTGLALTAGFATAAVGHLNLISIAFAVLYIGLSVDYAIHFCLRYRELLQQGESSRGAVANTVARVGGSLALCAVTTAVGFYAFLPTDFIGVSELGLISGTGMFISLVVSLTLLPALLTLLPPPRRVNSSNASNPSGGVAVRLQQHPRFILASAILLGLAALLLLPRVRFDFNTLNLKDPATESVATFNDLLAESETSPWSTVVLAEDKAAAVRLKTRLQQLDGVANAVIIDDFVPQQQQEKQLIIEDIAWLLGELQPGPADAMSVTAQIAALSNFKTVLEAFLQTPPTTPLNPSAAQLLVHLDGFLQTLTAQDKAGQARLLADLENALLGSLLDQWRQLTEALEADPVTLATLPEDLRARWVTPDGRYRIEVWPQAKLADNAALRRFVADVQAVAPQATEEAAIVVAAGDAVVNAFVEAFSYALAAITLLLLLLLRHRRDILMVLIPLLLAGALTGAASVLLAIPFNFANVIALPLLLGMGVDSSIHMLQRFHQVGGTQPNLLATSTARAVFYSALTTLCSFGTLAFSAHPGTASMGQLLTIGLAFTLVCTLILLPALLACFHRSGVFSPAAADRK